MSKPHSFAYRLHEARIKAKLTQQEAAKLTGYSQSLICMWEKGQRTPPSEKAAVTQERVLAAILKQQDKTH